LNKNQRRGEMKKTVYGLLIVIMIALLAGCATTSGSAYSSSEEAKPLDVATLLKFNDVPVPSGFRILDTESFAFQNDNTRVALLKYIGPVTADQVVQFYKEQMPIYNWNPINIIEYERRILNYEKDQESCIITVETKGRKSIITIAISPKSRPMKVEKEEK
jgi:hypothetical protein